MIKTLTNEKATEGQTLAERMPSPELFAKVGAKKTTPLSLARRMPSPELAAKVGPPIPGIGNQPRRVHRRNGMA